MSPKIPTLFAISTWGRLLSTSAYSLQICKCRVWIILLTMNLHLTIHFHSFLHSCGFYFLCFCWVSCSFLSFLIVIFLSLLLRFLVLSLLVLRSGTSGGSVWWSSWISLSLGQISFCNLCHWCAWSLPWWELCPWSWARGAWWQSMSSFSESIEL